MTELLPPATSLLAFVAASTVLAVTPGPAVVYIVARALAHGRRAGLASIAGVALGNLGNAAGASLGLAALFAVSSAAFSVVKWAGAAYLVWLGIQALRGPRRDVAAGVDAPPSAVGHARVFRDGAVVALLNPKTAIFFAAFLPQFMDPARPWIGQSLALGAIFVAIAAASDLVYVLLATVLGARWRARGGGAAARHGRFGVASIYVGLGLYTAFADQRASRPAH